MSESIKEGRSEAASAVKDGVIGAAATALAAAAWSVDSFIYLAAQSGLYEIKASEIAVDRSARDDVKALARRMIADHKDIATKLGSFVGEMQTPRRPPEKLDKIHEVLIDDLKGAAQADFDRRYLAQQKDAHTTAITLFKSYIDHGHDSGLRNLAALGLPVLEEHMEMVEQTARDRPSN